jgi:hypothetical protein
MKNVKTIVNPENYKDLIGKKFICAYLNVNSGKNALVENIERAKLKVICQQIVKFEVTQGKRNYREVVYFDKADRHGRTHESTWHEGGLDWLKNRKETVRYQYEDDTEAPYYCGYAEYYAEDNGQTDEEIRAVLEKAVRTEIEKELERIAKELEFWKAKEEKLKNFIKK